MTNLDTIFSAKVAKSISNSQELGFLAAPPLLSKTFFAPQELLNTI